MSQCSSLLLPLGEFVAVLLSPGLSLASPARGVTLTQRKRRWTSFHFAEAIAKDSLSLSLSPALCGNFARKWPAAARPITEPTDRTNMLHVPVLSSKSISYHHTWVSLTLAIVRTKSLEDYVDSATSLLISASADESDK